MALSALHTELLQPPTKVGVIGSGCSLATEPTAEISHFYNITHVSMTYVAQVLVALFYNTVTVFCKEFLQQIGTWNNCRNPPSMGLPTNV